MANYDRWPGYTGGQLYSFHCIFKDDKSEQKTFLQRGGKPSAPCRRILLHVKIPAKYDRYTTLTKFKDISRQLPAPLLGVSAATRALADEPGMIRNKTGTHKRSENISYTNTWMVG
jgi:hypothetical protein